MIYPQYRPSWRERFDWKWSRLRWAGLALRQHTTADDNWSMMGGVTRWWLTIKVIISMILDRPIPPWRPGYGDESEWVVVASADGHSYPSMDCMGAWEWKQLIVRRWRLGYEIRSETNC